MIGYRKFLSLYCCK